MNLPSSSQAPPTVYHLPPQYPTTSYPQQIQVFTLPGGTTSVNIQQPQAQLQVHFTNGVQTQQRTLVQIHHSQTNGQVISVENGGFKVQVTNYVGYTSHVGYPSQTDKFIQRSVQETRYGCPSELALDWKTLPPYCVHGMWTGVNTTAE